VSDARGQWVVCVRDIAANDNTYVGPFHSEENADKVAVRLRRDIEAVGAGHLLEAFVEWVRPASTDLEEFRDEMLRDLEEMGYART
jgi:hypothetical protein